MDPGMEIVPVSELKVGMFVAEPDCPWTDLPFSLQGFIIAEPAEIDTFKQHCQFVYIDRAFSTGEQFRAALRERDIPLQSQPFSKREVSAEVARRQEKRRHFLRYLYDQDASVAAKELSRELSYIEPHFDSLQDSLRKTLDGLQVEDKVDFRNIEDKLGELSNSLMRNPDAVMWLLRLKKADDHSFDQAMDVAVYLLLLGKHVGFTGKRLTELSLAGLLQDVGKTALPPRLLVKVEELTDAERELVRSHVASSLELLCLQHSLPPEVLMIVANHHERWDGSGYPRGLKLKQIGTAAEMAGLIDSFCAMMKSKPYRPAMGHQEALEKLYQLRDHQFNPALLEQLVQCVGLYPIGTLLELDSGEVGVVIQQSRTQRSRPRVLLLLDEQKEKIRAYQVIDLREPRFSNRHVKKALPHDAYGLLAEDYYLA